MSSGMIKTTIREIKASFGRYMAIVAIVMLGVGLFTGLKATTPAMIITENDYLLEQDFFDFRLLSTVGFDEESVAEIEALPEIADAEGAVSVDALCAFHGENEDVFKFHTVPETINRVVLTAGRMPEKADECVLDAALYGEESIGMQITVTDNNDEDTLEMFKNRTFTAVGVVRSPYYINFERGTASIGDGKINAFLYVPKEAFDCDYLTELYVTTKLKYKVYTDEYNNYIDELQGKIEDKNRQLVETRYNRLIAEAQDKIDDAQTELDDKKAEAEEELADARQQILDGEEELADAEKEIADARKKIEDGKQEIKEHEQEIADGEQEIADGEQEIADGEREIQEKEQEIRDAEEEIKLAEWKIFAGGEELAEARAQLEEGKKELQAQENGLFEKEAALLGEEQKLLGQEAVLLSEEENLLEQENYLRAQIAQMESVSGNNMPDQAILAGLRAMLAQIQAGKEEIAAGKMQIQAGKEQIAAGKMQIQEGKEQIAAAKKEIEVNEQKIAEGEAGLSSGRKQIAKADEEIADGKKKLEEAKEELADARAELEDGKAELEDGKTELKKAKKDLADAERELAEGDAELEDGKAELADAKAEYADAEAEFEEEVQDAQKKIDDARAELADIEEPDDYVLTRETNIGYACYESDSNIVDAIANVFPVFFFLVAALICMTTMNRMVEEQRTQIGVLKALGYSNAAIMGKYLFYAGSAAVFGAVIGCVGGTWLFPKVIWMGYGIMYSMGDIMYYFDIRMALLSVAAALLCSMGAAYFSCRYELHSVPANLIRPKAPKNGKRIFLEKITFIWRRMKFLHKVSVRNIIRYKKRFFMMILGISGCTALLLTGFGIKDSVTNVADMQYDEIQIYDIEITMSDKMQAEDMENLAAQTEDFLSQIAWRHEKSVELDFGGKTKSVYLEVPEDVEAISSFIDLHTSAGEKIPYPGEGEAVLTEKMAETLGIQNGDRVTLRDNDMNSFTVTISALCENFVNNYIYIDKGTYEKQFGEEPEYKSAYVKVSDSLDVHEAAAAVSDMDHVLAVSVTADMRERIGTMMESMDYIVLLIIVCAGSLAFIVLYNLTNINITERIREIATIKVLGFYARETADYVFRENMVLTGLGAVVGLGLGKWLHWFVMYHIRIDMVSFKTTITPVSYIWSLLFTFAFAMMVNGIMYFKLEKINMAESLKSIE